MAFERRCAALCPAVSEAEELQRHRPRAEDADSVYGCAKRLALRTRDQLARSVTLEAHTIHPHQAAGDGSTMYEQELQKIIAALREMETRFEPPAGAVTPELKSTDRAAFKRLMLEAKSVLDTAIGINDFGLPLLRMTTLPGFGAFNPPMLEELHEAIGLVEGGLNQVRRKSCQIPTTPGAAAKPAYVDPARILQLRNAKQQPFDLKRLVRLLEELNVAHEHQLHMASAMLVRAVLDHVPPVFNAKNFSEVANNYAAPRSFSEQMQQLDRSLRKIADTHLHQPMRKSEVLPLAPQVDFRGAVDVLLSEVVRLLQ